MDKYCIKCGSPLMDNATFCHRCGQSVSAPKAPSGRGVGIAALVVGFVSMIYSIFVCFFAIFKGIFLRLYRYFNIVDTVIEDPSSLFDLTMPKLGTAELYAPFFISLFVLGALGVVLSCIARTKGFRSVLCSAGLVMSIAALSFCALAFFVLLF